jgi:putative oxidoreductase
MSPLARLAGRLPSWSVWLLALAVAATFVVASLDKIANPGDFAQSIYRYRLLPLALLHPFALALPWLELVAGLAVLWPSLRRGGALLAALMSLMFIGALGLALLRGLDINCGCFKAGGGHGVDLGLIGRDILLFAACLPLIVRPR